MDREPAPPRRPRRLRADERLIIFAMIVVATLALVPFLIIEAEWRWLGNFVKSKREWFFYGLPTLTMAVLGLSLVAKSRDWE